MATALVTGGTSGIGAQFARQLAARGFDIILVARDEARLAATAAELHAAHGIHVETIAADLQDRADVDRVAERLANAAPPVDILINNAGFGVREGYVTGDPRIHDDAYEVMGRAVRVLSSVAARGMAERGRGAIVNISSLQTYLATGSYGALKAWVTAFSQGLAVELRGTGVTVTAVLPGWVATEWHARAGMNRSSLPSWMWTQPEDVVRIALRDMDRGRVISIPTVRYRILGWFARHLPLGVIRSISARISSSRSVPAAVGEGSEHPVGSQEEG